MGRVTYSICWICNYVGDLCDLYEVLEGFTASWLQFHILQGAYAYDLWPLSSKFSFQK